jgi:hypothetical protein
MRYRLKSQPRQQRTQNCSSSTSELHCLSCIFQQRTTGRQPFQSKVQFAQVGIQCKPKHLPSQSGQLDKLDIEWSPRLIGRIQPGNSCTATIPLWRHIFRHCNWNTCLCQLLVQKCLASIGSKRMRQELRNTQDRNLCN